MNNNSYINGQQLYFGISEGIKNLLEYQDKLDEINVFPVPDGDTGTNMCFTLIPVVEECEELISDRVDETLDVIANSALDSARGNSGTIIAQFFHGFRRSMANLESASKNDFAAALQNGYQSAHDSLLNPEEGTIITVMRDVANTALELKDQENINYIKFMNKCYRSAEQSLQRTKTILKILKKTDVVDAGALGFVLIIQGVLNSIQKGSQIQSTHLDISYQREKVDALKKDIDFTITNRYCTECAIEGNNIDRKELKELIKHCGDSMVVAGTNKRVKIHVHTNEPSKFFKICNAYGKVVDRKVDDMTKQEHSIHHTGTSGIAIVVDSGADIPEEYANDIQVVPVRYSFGNQQHIDKVTQSVREFYQQMETDSNHPKTSQPTPGDFKKTYNFISSHYDSIISIHLSKTVSGTFQSAVNASKKIKLKNMKIIDSRSASVGLGLLAMYAVDLKQEGKSFKQIISMVNKKRNDITLYAIFDDLRYVVRGGRVPPKIKTIANLLRLRPVLGVKKGKLKARGVLYGKSRVVNKLAYYLSKKIKPEYKYRLLVAHSNAKERGDKLMKTLISQHPNIEQSYLLELGGALGAHAGPNSVVVAFHPID